MWAPSGLNVGWKFQAMSLVRAVAASARPSIVSPRIQAPPAKVMRGWRKMNTAAVEADTRASAQVFTR